MATYDHHSDFADCIADPASSRSRLRIDSRIAAFPENEKEQRSPSSTTKVLNDAPRLFQDTLLESGGKSGARNHWVTVLTLAFQLVVLAAAVVIPLFHTDTLPKPEILTMLVVPPRAAASGTPTFRAPTSTSRTTPTNLRISSGVHTTQEAPSPPLDTAGGLVGGIPGGVVGGIPDGMLSNVLRDTGRAPVLATTSAPKRIRVPAPMTQANLVYDVAPKYPPEAGRARIEGTVVLFAVIGKDGTVQDVRVENGLPVLAQAAIEAVKQWRYRPYLLNGEPVEVDSQITINFTLSKG